MFCEDKTIETLEELVNEVKQYVALQREYAKLELVEKLSVILSSILMVLIVVVLGLMTLFYLLGSLAYIIAPYVGGMKGSLAIIAGITVILIAIAIIFKKQLFVRPLIGFMTGVFFKNDKK